MTISEKKIQIVIDNYFKSECDVNTSIRQAFEKGFRIGIKKGQSAEPERKKGKWLNRRIVYMDVHIATCDQCGKRVVVGNFCRNCGADMRRTGDSSDE